MRQLQLISQGIFAFAFLVSVHAQSNTNGIIGQWDFNTNDVTAATIGAPLQLVGGIQGTFQTNQVNGRFVAKSSVVCCCGRESLILST